MKPKTTRQHMALQIAAMKARPYITFSGVDMLDRARARSSYDRRRAIPHSSNLRGSGWSKSWDCRIVRLPEMMAAVKRMGRRATRIKLAIKLGVAYRSIRRPSR